MIDEMQQIQLNARQLASSASEDAEFEPIEEEIKKAKERLYSA